MKIFKYLKKYWYFALLAPLFMCGEVMMDLFQPKLVAKIVDEGLISDTLEIVVNTGLLMLGLTLVGGACGLLSGVFANKAAFSYGNDLRKDVFKHIDSLSFEQVDYFSTGSLVTRVTNDITQVTNIVSMSVRMVFRTLMQFIFGVIFLLRIDLRFGYILLVIMPIIIIILVFFIKKISPYFTIMQNRVDDVNSVVQENVTGARVVKAYTAEEKEINRFSNANKNLYDVNWTVFKRLAFLSPIFNLIVLCAIVIVIYIGGVTVDNNYVKGITDGLGVGEIISAIDFMIILISGFLMFVMIFQSIIRGLASIKRLNEVLNSTPTIKEGEFGEETDTKGSIEFKDVSFAYPGEVDEQILKGINLKINKGEKIGILGATGSGKTSLVSLITRFYDVTSGSIEVDGVDVKDYKFKTLRDKVAMVLQKSELFSVSIKDNICWGKKDATIEEVIHASKLAQADSFITGFTDGYDTMVAEKGASLSGGQKQRISIARALIKNPEIIIFDDSTSALDLETEANLYQAIGKELKDMTVITIAQRVASVKNADKIVVLNDGMIASIGSHEELMKSSPIYIDIYNSQIKEEGEKHE